jgi:hypothetical protein
MLVVFFGGLLGSTAFAGAPPSVGGPAGAPGGPSGPGKRGAISFELGYYSPSLKTVNDDMKVWEFPVPEIGGNLLLSVKSTFGGGASPVYGYVGLSYWSSSSTRDVDNAEAKVTLFSMPVGVEIPILTGTLPEQVMLHIDIDGKLVLPFWRFGTTTDYYTAWSLGYDAGVRVGGQYFVVPNRFSLGGTIGYAFLGKTGQLTVLNSTLLPPWPQIDDKLLTSDRKKEWVFELSGITLMFDVRLWF